MTGRNGQELLSSWVPADLADRFKAWARGREGGTSAELRRMVTEAVDGVAPSPPPGSSGYRVTVRLKFASWVLATRRFTAVRSPTSAGVTCRASRWPSVSTAICTLAPRLRLAPS